MYILGWLMTQKNLRDLRSQIDIIDHKLLELLDARMKVVSSITASKQEQGLPIFDSQRESEVLNQLQVKTGENLSSADIITIYQAIMDRSKMHQIEAMLKSDNTQLEVPEEIAIVGLGLMGGSLALALQKYQPKIKVSFCDILDRTEDVSLPQVSLENALKSSWVVLALSPTKISKLLEEKAHLFQKGQVVLDLGSTKRKICLAAEKFLPEGTQFIGCHPMVGKTSGGFEHAESNLFFGQSFFAVPTARSDTKSIELLNNLVSSIGAKLTITSAAQHDKVTAFTSHLPHLLSRALYLSLPEPTQIIPYAAGSLNDLCRVAEADSGMVGDIFETNYDYVLEAFQIVVQSVDKIVDKEGQVDRRLLKEISYEVKEFRKQILKVKEKYNAISNEKESSRRGAA